MKNFAKRCCLLSLALIMCVPLVACNKTQDTNLGTPTDSEPPASQDPSETHTEPPMSLSPSEAFEGKPAAQSLESGTLLNVTDESLKKYVTTTVKDGYTFFNYDAPVFEIGGIPHPSQNNGNFNRLNTLDSIQFSAFPKNVVSNSWNTSGGTVRFRTNASYFVLNAKVHKFSTGSRHIAPRGVYGFDVYIGSGTKRVYCGEAGQLMVDTKGINEVIKLPGGWIEVIINLPLYGGVNSLEIGLPDGAQVAAPLERSTAPILFYGSSITQGACVNRPGCAYTNIVTRMLDADCINLGFSSGAYGEQIVAEYVATRGEGAAAIVLDYDRNSDVNGLRAHHYDFYKTIRNKLPDVPIILVSRTIYTEFPSSEDKERINIVMNTYNKAVEAGDENIYFIDGSKLFSNYFESAPHLADLITVDNRHPNEVGHFYMAMSIYDTLYQILDK